MVERKKRLYKITGNWKMNKTIREGREFIETLASKLAHRQAASQREKIEIGIAPPYTSIHSLSQLVLERGLQVAIGAQNVASSAGGAFTGEVSAQMLKEAGASFVLIGHSERRKLFFESDEVIKKKLTLALETALEVTLCVGESLEERNASQMEEVLVHQLEGALKGMPINKLQGRLTLAYEPLWAIGTGQVASPRQAQEAHQFLRKRLAVLFGEAAADEIPIQYGGSVHPDNSKELLQEDDVDGLLIGGSSLSADLFAQIIQSCGAVL